MDPWPKNIDYFTWKLSLCGPLILLFSLHSHFKQKPIAIKRIISLRAKVQLIVLHKEKYSLLRSIVTIGFDVIEINVKHLLLQSILLKWPLHRRDVNIKLNTKLDVCVIMSWSLHFPHISNYTNVYTHSFLGRYRLSGTHFPKRCKTKTPSQSSLRVMMCFVLLLFCCVMRVRAIETMYTCHYVCECVDACTTS